MTPEVAAGWVQAVQRDAMRHIEPRVRMYRNVFIGVAVAWGSFNLLQIVTGPLLPAPSRGWVGIGGAMAFGVAAVAWGMVAERHVRVAVHRRLQCDPDTGRFHWCPACCYEARSSITDACPECGHSLDARAFAARHGLDDLPRPVAHAES